MKKILIGASIFFASLTAPAFSAWHGGTVRFLAVAYDGSTIAFQLLGWSRNNCTCYAPWPDSMCLNRSRASFKEEVAMLYSARARGATLNANIDENTCQVTALYEID